MNKEAHWGLVQSVLLSIGLALLTGAAVAGITLLADRLGGKVGGLLATAPVTTSAALLLLAASDPAALHARLMMSGSPLLASTLGIIAFFFTVKFTRGRPDRVRLASGLLAYGAAFVGFTLLLYGILPAESWVFGVLFLLHIVLLFTLVRVPIPPLQGYRPKPYRLTGRELAVRFGAGSVFFFALSAIASTWPDLAPAFAVFPAVFMVSLGVMGLSQNAPFAARASQMGVLGTSAVALFVLTFDVLAELGVVVALAGAWVVYFLALATLGKLREGLEAARTSASA